MRALVQHERSAGCRFGLAAVAPGMPPGAPLEHAGKLSSVSVGGKAWGRFDASAETVDFRAEDLTAEMVATGLPSIVAAFS